MAVGTEFVAPLDKEQFMRVYGDLKRSEFKELETLISTRLNYVFRKAMDILELDVSWYDYDNEVDEHCPGFFDETRYIQTISLTGRFKNDYRADIDMSEIPVEWIYSDFESELAERYATWKEQNNKAEQLKQAQAAQAKNEKKSRNARRDSVHKAIREKLTADELSFVKLI